jgi:Pyruvate/2-oxoacid:ferredoxin oxidoreductase delta subunit
MYEQQGFHLHLAEDSFMEVLRLQFTPGEADLALKVGFEGGKLDQLQKKTGIEKDKLKNMLTTMAYKGTMWVSAENEGPVYKTMGVGGPGLVETGGWAHIKLPHSVALNKALHKFQVEFSTECLPALGVPVARVWLTPAALPEDAKPEENVAEMIKRAGRWGIGTCSCRLPHWIATPGDHCEHLLDVCLFLGDMVRWGVDYDMCKEVTCDEVLGFLTKCNEDGLVHSHDPNEFICNCCNDCCVLLMGHYVTGSKILEPSEFIPRFDESDCSACGICADRCPVDAIEVDDSANVDLEKCLGCGVCFPTCPTESIHFERR